MAKGNYIVSAINENTDIKFQLQPDAEKEIPAEQQDLVFEVQATLGVLRVLYNDDQSLFSNYFDQLLKLSQVGLVGDDAKPDMAHRALDQLKNEIENRESGKVKNRHLRKLGALSICFGLPALIVGSLLNYLHCCDMQMLCLSFLQIGNFLILWAGTMLGVWLSFAITKTYIEFNDLTIVEKDRLEPSLRLIFSGMLALVFGFLFIKEVIVISIGDLSSSHVHIDPVSAFLLGVILGLNEKIIGRTLTKKTAGLLGAKKNLT